MGTKDEAQHFFLNSGMTDHLVQDAMTGDSIAYNALFERLGSRLLFYIKARMGGDLRAKCDAEDVRQDTYLRAHHSFDQFSADEPGAIHRWIYRLADNSIRDAAKHLKAKKRSTQKSVVGGSNPFIGVAAEQVSPLSECILNETEKRLLHSVDRLGPAERDLVLLRYFHQETHAAIAEQLKLSESGVRGMLARVHLKLGADLDGESA